jgi:hypothetical protein
VFMAGYSHFLFGRFEKPNSCFHTVGMVVLQQRTLSAFDY